MSRSGYIDDCDLESWEMIRWRGAVASAIRGKRGQALLRELLAALDAMPDKRLISGELVAADGEVCALGAVACARGMDVSNLDPEDYGAVAVAFNVSEALAREIEFENDERGITPEERWKSMRRWVVDNIKDAPSAPGGTEGGEG